MQGFVHDATALAPEFLVVVVAFTALIVALATFRVLDQNDRFIGDRLTAAIRSSDAESTRPAEPTR